MKTAIAIVYCSHRKVYLFEIVKENLNFSEINT